jgi:uncharacterized protein (DUF302 family)
MKTDMSEALGFTVELPMAYDDAVNRTRSALKDEGFGILTEIDLRAAFREKLGKEFRPYVILGACNPPLAYRAMNAEPEVGLLLPCNVTVEATGPSTSTVRLANPSVLLAASESVADNDTMREVAGDARQRIERVASALRAGS